MRHRRVGLAAGLAALALGAACTPDRGEDPGAAAPASVQTPVVGDCAAGSFRVAGPGTQRIAVARWTEGYRSRCGARVSVTFEPATEADALARLRQGRVPIAGSAAPLSDAAHSQVSAACGTGRVVSVPILLTPLILAYNLPSVPDLILTPGILARIYTGRISTWNDPEIAKANPGVQLPNRAVTAVHRSGSSAATEAFTTLLDARAGEVWTSGASRTWPAPAGVAAPTAEGVGRAVGSTEGSIGYLEGEEAHRAGLARARLDAGTGAVAPSAESVGRAASAGAVEGDDLDIRLRTDPGLEEPGAYPLLLVSYAITCSEGLPVGPARFAEGFLTYACGDGQAALGDLGYAPLPARLLSRVRGAVGALGGS